MAVLAALYHYFGCPGRYLFGISCPGCGMVRAAFCLLRLDFAGAWRCHPMIFTMPLFIAWGVFCRKKKKSARGFVLTLCVCLTAVYVWRLAAAVSPEIVYFAPERGLLRRLWQTLTGS